MSMIDLGKAVGNSPIANNALAAVGTPGAEGIKDLFQKHGKELAAASMVLKKIPHPKAQIAAKCIDVGLTIFNGKDDKVDGTQFGKLAANKDNFLSASGIVGPNMSAGKIYANKMMAGMKNGLSFDAAEKDTIGFMSKLMSPEKLSKILDEKSMNFLNGGSIGIVKSTIDALKPKEMSENTKENTLSLGSVFDHAGKSGRSSRGERGGIE